jgi:hypothetical protein
MANADENELSVLNNNDTLAAVVTVSIASCHWHHHFAIAAGICFFSQSI